MATFAALTYAGTTAAQAQAVLDDDSSAIPTTTTVETKSDKTQIGLGFRLRNVRIPQSLLEIFVERVPAGSSNLGLGLELSRRKGQFEVQFGVEYEKIEIEDGIWIDKGDKVPQDEPDFVEFDGFSWVTAELSFMYHTPIVPQFSVRYGGGAGIGVFMGDILRTDYRCTSEDLDTCDESPTAENRKTPYDLPPVMIVINAIVGVQIRPTDEIFINIEGGIRTMPFFGMTAGYYF